MAEKLSYLLPRVLNKLSALTPAPRAVFFMPIKHAFEDNYQPGCVVHDPGTGKTWLAHPFDGDPTPYAPNNPPRSTFKEIEG